MKRVNTLLLIATLAGSVSLMAGSSASLSESQQATLKKAIQKTPAIELAAQSVSLISKAQEADRTATALFVVRAAVKKNPATAASVVSAATTVVPELAPKLVAIVAEVAPDQTVAAARVATRVSSDLSDEIVSSVGAVSPKSVSAVTSAVQEEKAALAKLNTETSNAKSLVNAGRAFPPGSGGKVVKLLIPINPRLVFPTIAPKSVNNYATPGGDPNRPIIP